jgi:hypothetical protein
MLLGLNPILFGWMVESFLPKCDFESDGARDAGIGVAIG